MKATVSAANVVLPMLALSLSMSFPIPEYANEGGLKDAIPEYTSTYSCQTDHTPDLKTRPKLTDEQSNKLFSKLNLTSIKSWSETDQQKAVELLKEYHHLFALDDLEMGCTLEVKLANYNFKIILVIGVVNKI